MMTDTSIKARDRLDSVTSRSVCRAIGERLRASAMAGADDLPPQLQSLLAAMRQQEERLMQGGLERNAMA